MTTHVEARGYAKAAIQATFEGVTPSYGEIAALAGIACLETRYGDAWKGAGAGSLNLGAIQCGSSWQGKSFSYTDTHPNPDGTSTVYTTRFRAYSTLSSAWSDLCRVVFVTCGRHLVRESAENSDFLGVSQRLHDTGYYEGYGATVAERVAHHYRALSQCILAADASIPVGTYRDTLPYLELGRGMQGKPDEAVRYLQQLLGCAADGRFGPKTLDALRDYQFEHQLPVTGICDELTWKELRA